MGCRCAAFATDFWVKYSDANLKATRGYLMVGVRVRLVFGPIVFAGANETKRQNNTVPGTRWVPYPSGVSPTGCTIHKPAVDACVWT
jgi:hypothetical protein